MVRQEEARFLCRGVRYHAVALRAVEIELEQRDQLAALHEPIGAVDRRTGGVEVVRKHLLALCDLLGDARFELVECADVAPLVVALHFDQPARDDALGDVEDRRARGRSS